MRIGYLIDVHGGPYEQPMPERENVVDTLDAMIEEGITAERAGFHSLQVPDRHGRTETYYPGPLQLLTILAQETERIAIGSYCLVNKLYHPMLIAEQCSIIDNLSRGRLYMAFGRGYHPGYWQYFGVPEERMLGRFLENVRIIQTAMKGEKFSYDGDFYQVEDSILAPQPYQEGGFPIWGTGQFPPSIRRSAEYGEAWCGDDFPLLKEVWDGTVGAYRDHARELGKEPFVVLMRDGWVADTFEKAATEFGDHYVGEMRFYANMGILAHHPDFATPESITAEGTRDHVIMGSPDRCIEQIEMYREVFGVDYMTIRFRMPTGPSFEATKEQILRFGEEVVSYFNEKYPAPDHPAIPKGARS